MEKEDAALNLSTARKDGNNRRNPGSEIDSVVADPSVSIPVTQMAYVFSQPFLVVETGSRDRGHRGPGAAGRYNGYLFARLRVGGCCTRQPGFSHPADEQNVSRDHKAQEDDYC